MVVGKWYPRQDSNLGSPLRRRQLSPLSYEGVRPGFGLELALASSAGGVVGSRAYMRDSDLPPSPPTPRDLSVEQREFAARWERVRAQGKLLATVAIAVVAVNCAAAVAAARAHDWFLLAMSLLWAAMAVAGRFLLGWAGRAWQEAAVTRVERSQAYELAEQWRTLYLQATGRQEGDSSP